MAARSKSVLNILRQNNILSEGSSGQDPEVERVGSEIEAARSELGKLYVCFKLMFLYGLRVSEVLNIRWQDIDQEGYVWIEGLKGGKSRFVGGGTLRESLLQYRTRRLDPFKGIKRQTVYEYGVRFGWIAQSESSTKKSVCHYFRHLFVRRLRSQGFDDDKIAQIIGHRNSKNTSIYGRFKKEQ